MVLYIFQQPSLCTIQKGQYGNWNWKYHWKKPIENTILEIMSIEFSTNLMRTCVFPISRLLKHLENYTFQQSSLCKTKKQFTFSRTKIRILIYKRLAFCHLMTNSHSISIKLIQSHTFVNVFTNFDPRIHSFCFIRTSKNQSRLKCS